MSLKGNYWLELLNKEKIFKKEIDHVVQQIVGKEFVNYEDLHDYVMDKIQTHLEYYGLNNNLGEFKLDYNVDLHYNSDYCLKGWKTLYVYMLEENF